MTSDERNCPKCGAPVRGEPCTSCLLLLGLDETAERDDRPTELSPPGEASGTIPERVGNWRPVRVIGEGGMGLVYLVEEIGPLSRQAALKRIRFGLDSRSVLERFDQERRVLARLDHPGIARAIEAGTADDGAPFFVMEYVDGPRITDYCDRRRLPTGERLRLFSRLCDAVEHAHRRGILHRDLKPSNILVVDTPDGPQPKVIDFGVSRAVARHRLEWSVFTEFGRLVGTPEYMSPEQADLDNDDLDTRSDVYGLGVVLYELLVGCTPRDPRSLRGIGIEALLRTIREGTFPTPSARLSTLGDAAGTIAESRASDPERLRRSVAGELDWIVMRATENDRERRYGSPGELAADIGRYLDGLPVLAGPPGATYRVRKFVRRHRAAVGIAGAALAGLVVFASAMAWQARVIARERDRVRLEAATTERVVDFMADLFKVPRPDRSRGREITARELLENGATEIQEELGGEPDLRARLMAIMGNSFRDLGMLREAEPLLRQAWEIRQEVNDVDDPRRARATANLANLYSRMGRFDEAEPLAVEAVSELARLLGDDHPDTLSVRRNLGNLYFRLGRLEDAGDQFEKAYDTSRRLEGDTADVTLQYLNNLAAVYSMTGRDDRAIEAFETILEANREVLGADHPRTLSTMSNLAIALFESGRVDEAEPRFREAEARQTEVMGDEHPDTLRTRSNLAVLGIESGRMDEFETLMLDTIERQARVLGANHPETTASRFALARGYVDADRHGEAEPILRDLIETRETRFGRDHVATQEALHVLAGVHAATGRVDDARATYAAVQEFCDRELGPDHELTRANREALESIDRRP